MASTTPTVIVIADYGTGDPAFSEVLMQLKMLIPEAFLHAQSVPAFSTLTTGFWMYQLGMTPGLTHTYIFSNTAPRKHEAKAQINNSGEKLMYARLTNGFEMIGVNAGYVFSFVKTHLAAFHFVNSANEGSQFRSRDIYPKAVARLVHKDDSFLGEKADIAIIPDFPKNVVAAIDGYGNIKTTLRQSRVELAPGQHLTITLHGVTKPAIYSDGTFSVAEGEIAFAPGSSGHDDRFMEIFYRGQSAAALFNNPPVEVPFTIT